METKHVIINDLEDFANENGLTMNQAKTICFDLLGYANVPITFKDSQEKTMGD
jgi:hypothetical protein